MRALLEVCVHVHPVILLMSGPEGAGKTQKVLTPAWGHTDTGGLCAPGGGGRHDDHGQKV